MTDRKYPDGTKFNTPDGKIEIIGIARDYDQIVYAVKYNDVIGQPTSTLSEQELENNPNITLL